MKHAFKDVIFVMEDVDAASPIVMSRGPTEKPKDKENSGTKLEKQNSVNETAQATSVSDVAMASEGTVMDEMTAGTGDSAELMMAMISSLADPTSGSKTGVRIVEHSKQIRV